MVRKTKGKKEHETRKIDEIIKSTPVDMNHLKRQVWIEGVVLSLPLVVSFGFYLNTILRSTSSSAGEMLSPPASETLVLFVLMFIIVYSLFLAYEYRRLYKKIKPHSKK